MKCAQTTTCSKLIYETCSLSKGPHTVNWRGLIKAEVTQRERIFVHGSTTLLIILTPLGFVLLLMLSLHVFYKFGGFQVKSWLKRLKNKIKLMSSLLVKRLFPLTE